MTREQLQEMKASALKQYAADNSISLEGCTTKTTIIEKIWEANGMENMEGTSVEVTEAGEAVAEKVARLVFTLDDGSEGSRAAYIKQEFKKDRSRGDIAKELGIDYGTVYGSTANMYNAVHTEGAGGLIGRTSELVAKAEFVDGKIQAVEVVEGSEPVMVPRAEMMRELFAAGADRGLIKDFYEVKYATVYAATKVDGEVTPRVEHVIEMEDGTTMKRPDYIRHLYQGGKGMDRKAIAKHLTEITGEYVDYSTVWSATKSKDEAPATTEAAPEATPEVESPAAE